MAKKKKVDWDVWQFHAMDYCKTSEETIDVAQELVAKLHLPPIYREAKLARQTIADAAVAHDTWGKVQDVTQRVIVSSLFNITRQRNDLYRKALTTGENSDSWLREFSLSYSPGTTEQQMKRNARTEILNAMRSDIASIYLDAWTDGRTVKINSYQDKQEFDAERKTSEDDTDGNSIRVIKIYGSISEAFMRLVSQNITVSAMAMGSVCEMVDQVLKALQGENDQKKIEEGFRAWAGSLTKTRVQSFQAHRLPHYLKLADALRVPAQS